jgi:hypothetical protein
MPAHDRRRFLTALGLGGLSPLLTPMLGRLASEALGQTPRARRIVFYLDTLGTSASLRPQRTGGEAAFNLGAFSALEAHKKDVLVVGNMYNPFDLHLHGNRWFMSMTKGIPTGVKDGMNPGGPSFDRFVAQSAGRADPFPSLNLLAWPTKEFSGVAADGASKPFPALPGPVQAFEQVFGRLAAGAATGTGAPDVNTQARLQRDRSLLDFVTADVSRLRGRLATQERAKLDQYLESVRGLEQKLTRLVVVEAGCRKPERPSPTIDQGGRVPERMKANLDFIAAALTCGLTRVAVLDVPGSGSLPFLGHPDIGVHGGMWHGGGPELHKAYYRYASENLVYLWNRLTAVREGDGTFADGTLIVLLNKSGGNHHNGSYDYWALLLGSARGHLRSGRYLALPTSPMQAGDPRAPAGVAGGDGSRGPAAGKPVPVHAVSDLYVSLAEAMGVATKTFGDPAHCRGPLPGLV